MKLYELFPLVASSKHIDGCEKTILLTYLQYIISISIENYQYGETVDAFVDNWRKYAQKLIEKKYYNANDAFSLSYLLINNVIRQPVPNVHDDHTCDDDENLVKQITYILKCMRFCKKLDVDFNTDNYKVALKIEKNT